MKQPEKEKYGFGGFSDQYDNSRIKSMDRDQHRGGVTGVPFEDDFDIETNDYFPNHGEGYPKRAHRFDYPRDNDLSRGRTGTSWNQITEPMDNIARSDLRPDLHPERNFAGRGPKGWKRTDERIREEVCMALENSHEVDASHMEVQVEDGCVYLKGNIASKGMQRVAEDLVGSVPGVVDVFTLLKTEIK